MSLSTPPAGFGAPPVAAPAEPEVTATPGLTLKAKRQLIAAYYLVLFPVVALTAFGLVMTMSANTVSAISANQNPYTKGLKQAAFALAGLVVALVLAHLHRRLWQTVAWAALIATMVLQAMVVVQGISRGGNQNWLRLGPVEIQPSEAIKFALALWLGSVLALKKEALTRWFDLIVPALIGIAGAMGLVLLGRDAGTALVIGVLAVGALILAGVPWSKLAAIGLPLVAGAALLILTDAGRLERVRLALNPESCTDPLDSCWQITQASYALSEGGWLGTGLGASRQKWEYLSQADSDFIYAIIGEEVGLGGTMLVLLLFALLGFGLFRIVRLHPDRFTQITVGAIGCWLMAQALINIGMVIQVLPVIGVPLPFVSAGGSALVSSLAAIGVVIGLMRLDPEVAEALRPRSRRSLRLAGVFGGGGR
ncbi:MAG: putative lipid II flippase FtsW [Bifidobacteriaceae bacterium]|nr:putative lipid II flippase FtsW [Bifidobacteriaceae bacterium]